MVVVEVGETNQSALVWCLAVSHAPFRRQHRAAARQYVVPAVPAALRTTHTDKEYEMPNAP